MLALRPVLQPQGVLMGDGADRREARRFTMSLPMRVLPREAKGHELDAHTRDVSYRGLYFLADANFEVGSEIEFVITLPQQVTQSYGMRKQSFFLQFLERDLGVIVIHGFPQQENTSSVLYSEVGARGGVTRKAGEKKFYAAVAAAGMNS